MEENLNNKENAVSKTAAADACAIEGAAAVPTAAEKRKRRFSIVMLISFYIRYPWSCLSYGACCLR